MSCLQIATVQTSLFLLLELGYLQSLKGWNYLNSNGIFSLNLKAEHGYDTRKVAKKENINGSSHKYC